jgi:RimJ/RimL family protein N-acetyltransferase
LGAVVRTGQDAAIHIECASRCWTDGSEAWFTICEAGNAGYCGEVALRPEGDRRRANLEYWLVPEMRARGYATRAVNLVTAWAFSELGIARVQLWTEPDNLASQRVAVASGFTREGVLRHYDEIDGQRVDSVFFSRLPGDTSATLSQHPMSTAYLTVLKPLVWARQRSRGGYHKLALVVGSCGCWQVVEGVRGSYDG